MPNLPADLYQRLGLTKQATTDDINKAYRKMSLLLHPDKVRQAGGHQDDIKQATEAFKELAQARDLLSDPEARAKYDHGSPETNDDWVLDVPEGLERPCVIWQVYRAALQKRFAETKLEPLIDDVRQTSLMKTNPMLSPHFSTPNYQNFYVLTRTDDTGQDSDERFTDVFALIKEKATRFTGESELPAFLKHPPTPEIVYEILLQFLKGRYYGNILTQVQTYLHTAIQHATANTALFKAVLQFISIQNLKLEHAQALEAIQALYDVFFEQHKKMEGQIALCEHLRDIALKECQHADAELASLKTAINQNDEKTTALLSNTLLTQKQIETSLSALATEKQRLHQLMKPIEAFIASKQASLAQMKQHQATLQTQKINPNTLKLLDSKYFKATLATTLSYYWQDSTPAVVPAALARMSIGVPLSVPEGLNARGLILYQADRTLVELGQASTTAQQYQDQADYFFDISATVPIESVRLNALICAGLCWHLAARQSVLDVDQMVNETLALKAYQLALEISAKMPPSYGLYATIHLSKYLSELHYAQTTLTLEDVEVIIAQFDGREALPASRYALFSVHGGSPLQSMEGAIDRAFYLITCFPTYSKPTPMLDQVFRQPCYIELMQGLIEQFSQTLALADPETSLTTNSELAEQLYYRYEKELTSADCSETRLNQFKMDAMVALLDLSGTSLSALNRYMNAPYIAQPQDADNFWIPGPLLYPDTPDQLGLTIYKSFDGYYLNPETGDIRLLLTKWMPGDALKDRLFTHEDVIALIEGGVGSALLSLDANSAYRKYDPLQLLRFAPHTLDETEYARCLFAADYWMKQLSQGEQISGAIPYPTKKINTLLDGLGEQVKREILVAAHADGDENDEQKSRATRFWIQMGEIPRSETARGYGVFIQYGTPDVAIKKQLLTIGSDGRLVDAAINVEDHSPEAQFARAMTEHYDKLCEILPVFKQLKEFYKISGAVQELQRRRVNVNREIEQAETHLASPAYWAEEAAKQKKEWEDNLHVPAYWERCLNDKKEALQRIFKNEAYWERQTDDMVTSWEKTRDALIQKSGDVYQHMVNTTAIEQRASLKLIYDSMPALAWTPTHPAFIQHYQRVRQNAFNQIQAGNPTLTPEDQQRIFDTVNRKKGCATTEESILQVIKASIYEDLKAQSKEVLPSIGEIYYQDACTQFLQGNVQALATMQAHYQLNKSLTADPLSVELNTRLEPWTARLSVTVQQELEEQFKEDGPKVGFPHSSGPLQVNVTQAAYAIDSPEFLRIYEALRSDKSQSQISHFSSTLADWAVNQASYLQQIEVLLDQHFSKQHLLNQFNQAVTAVRNKIKSKWISYFLFKHPTIQTSFDAPLTLESAIDSLLDGQVPPLAQALVKNIIQQTLVLLKHPQQEKTVHAQAAWDLLLEQEIVIQIERMKNPTDEDYGYLKPFFAEFGYKEAITAFMQGNLQPLTAGFSALLFENTKQELAVDLRVKAQKIVEKDRIEFGQKIEETANKYLTWFKTKATQEPASLLAEYIEESKKTCKNTIHAGKQFESACIRLNLGPIEKAETPPHTAYRVPALFSRHRNRHVYGGVFASPTYRALNDAKFNLDISTDFNRAGSISKAKETLDKVFWHTSNLNVSVQLKLSELRESVSRAEAEQRRRENRPSWEQPSFSIVPHLSLQTQLHHHTLNHLMNEGRPPQSPPIQPNLLAWRYTERLAQQRPPQPKVPASLPSSRPIVPSSLPSSQPTVASSLPSSRPTGATSLPSSRPTVPSSLPPSQPTVQMVLPTPLDASNSVQTVSKDQAFVYTPSGFIEKKWQVQGKDVFVRFNPSKINDNESDIYLLDFKIDGSNPSLSPAFEAAKTKMHDEFQAILRRMGTRKGYVRPSTLNPDAYAFSTPHPPLFDFVKREDIVLKQSQVKLLTLEDIRASQGEGDFIWVYTKDKKFFIAERGLKLPVLRNGYDSYWLHHPEVANLELIYNGGRLLTYDGHATLCDNHTGHYLCQGSEIEAPTKQALETFGLSDAANLYKNITFVEKPNTKIVRPAVVYEIELHAPDLSLTKPASSRLIGLTAAKIILTTTLSSCSSGELDYAAIERMSDGMERARRQTFALERPIPEAPSWSELQKKTFQIDAHFDAMCQRAIQYFKDHPTESKLRRVLSASNTANSFIKIDKDIYVLPAEHHTVYRSMLGYVKFAMRIQPLTQDPANLYLIKIKKFDKQMQDKKQMATDQEATLSKKYGLFIGEPLRREDAGRRPVDKDYHVVQYRGETLSQWLKTVDSIHKERVRIAIELCLKVHELHEVYQIAHRDLKLSNITVDREGHVQLIDLGLAKSIAAQQTDDLTLVLRPLDDADHLANRQAWDPDHLRKTLAEMGLAGVDTFDLKRTISFILKGITASLPPALIEMLDTHDLDMAVTRKQDTPIKLAAHLLCFQANLPINKELDEAEQRKIVEYYQRYLNHQGAVKTGGRSANSFFEEAPQLNKSTFKQELR